MDYSYLELEVKDNGVAVITFNSPEKLNALGIEISNELLAALEEIDGDDRARAVVIRGAGRAFSSGGNLADMREGIADDPGKYMDELTAAVYTAIRKVLEMGKPSIAAVHGVAYGAALNLVVACDLAVAAEGTRFCESFLKLGLIPGGLATILLPSAMGLKRATELCLTAREVLAEEALELGLINKVVPADKLEEEAFALAEKCAQAPPLAVAETKRLLWGAHDRKLDEQADLERETQIRMARTKDFKEGIDAFFEKRKPRFTGK